MASLTYSVRRVYFFQRGLKKNNKSWIKGLKRKNKMTYDKRKERMKAKKKDLKRIKMDKNDKSVEKGWKKNI